MHHDFSVIIVNFRTRIWEEQLEVLKKERAFITFSLHAFIENTKYQFSTMGL